MTTEEKIKTLERAIWGAITNHQVTVIAHVETTSDTESQNLIEQALEKVPWNQSIFYSRGKYGRQIHVTDFNFENEE